MAGHCSVLMDWHVVHTCGRCPKFVVRPGFSGVMSLALLTFTFGDLFLTEANNSEALVGIGEEWLYVGRVQCKKLFF